MKKEIDSFGLAGVILNVVVTGIESIGFLVLLVVGLVVIWSDSIGFLYIIIATFFGTLAVVGLVFNSRLLAGEIKNKKIASVLGFICLSILGSVLLSISKEEEFILNPVKSSIVEDLSKFKELYDANIITEAEYNTLKSKIIN